MVPPAAIGAMCAAAVIVIGFICFKLVYGIFRRRQDSRRTPRGGSAHELPGVRGRGDGQPVDLEAFEPPPTYAQCVHNSAYMPEDAFKPHEAPGSSSVPAEPSSSSGEPPPPPPPSYHRILSGEFKELTLTEQRKVARGESIFRNSEFSVDQIPRGLRPHRTRIGSLESDPNSNNPRYQDPSSSISQNNSIFTISNTHPPPPPYTPRVGSGGGGVLNVAFTNDEFNDILSAMQSVDTNNDGVPEADNFTGNIMLPPETQTTDQYRNYHHHHHLPVNTTNETADVYSNRGGHNNYAYTHSNYDDENSLPNEICQDEENERDERVVNQRAEYRMNTADYAQDDDDEVLSPRGRTAERDANANTSTGLRVGGAAIDLRLSHINDGIDETSI